MNLGENADEFNFLCFDIVVVIVYSKHIPSTASHSSFYHLDENFQENAHTKSNLTENVIEFGWLVG